MDEKNNSFSLKAAKSNFCVHCTVTIALIMSCEELHVEGTEWERLDTGICGIYGVRSLTLIIDTFSLLSTKMSTADCFFLLQIKNRVVFVGSAGIAECDSFCAKRDS